MKYLFLPFLMSCSFLSSNKSVQLKSENLGKTLCLSGEGKGRVQMGGNKYLFKFESLLMQEKNKWGIELYFPLHNGELVEINWKKSPGFSGSLVGLFNRRQRDPRLKGLKTAFSQIRNWLSLLNDPASWKCSKSLGPLVCRKGNRRFYIYQLDGRNNYVSKMGSGKKFRFTSFSSLLDSGPHSRIQFATFAKRKGGAKKSEMTLDLFYSTCKS